MVGVTHLFGTIGFKSAAKELRISSRYDCDATPRDVQCERRFSDFAATDSYLHVLIWVSFFSRLILLIEFFKQWNHRLY